MEQLQKLNKRGIPLAPRNKGPSRKALRSKNATPALDKMQTEVESKPRLQQKRRSSSMDLDNQISNKPEWWLGLGNQLDAVLQKELPKQKHRRLKSHSKIPHKRKTEESNKRLMETYHDMPQDSLEKDIRQLATYDPLSNM